MTIKKFCTKIYQNSRIVEIQFGFLFEDFMQKLTLSSELDRVKLISYLNKRIEEYRDDLCGEGFTPQQYNILRGQIKELKNLASELESNK